MNSSNWLKYPVSEIANIILGGTPKTSEPKFWNGRIKWATAKDIAKCPTKHIKETEKRITELGLRKSNAKLLPKGTIVITARGTVGEIRVLGEPMAFNQTCYGIIPKNDIVDNDFLYYALKNAINRMKTLSYGTVFETITTLTFDELTISFPSNILEQHKIADILSSLDDKIELNYEMNKTLEAIAQAIFKNWFVDFEPFKDKLVYHKESNKKIPEGWDFIELEKIAKVTSGRRPENVFKEYSDDHCIPIYGGAGIMGYTTKSLFNERLIVTGRVGTLGLFHRVSYPSWPSDNTLVIIPNRDFIFEHLFFALKRLNIERFNRGTSNPLVTQRDLQRQRIILPPKYILIRFRNLITPIFALIDKNNEEKSTLSKIRDILLPKLLSGEIRVKVDIEKELPEEAKKLEKISEEKTKLQASLEKWLK